MIVGIAKGSERWRKRQIGFRMTEMPDWSLVIAPTFVAFRISPPLPKNRLGLSLSRLSPATDHSSLQ